VLEELKAMQLDLVESFSSHQQKAEVFQNRLKELFGINDEDRVKMDLLELFLYFERLDKKKLKQ